MPRRIVLNRISSEQSNGLRPFVIDALLDSDFDMKKGGNAQAARIENKHTRVARFVYVSLTVRFPIMRKEFAVVECNMVRRGRLEQALANGLCMRHRIGTLYYRLRFRSTGNWSDITIFQPARLSPQAPILELNLDLELIGEVRVREIAKSK